MDIPQETSFITTAESSCSSSFNFTVQLHRNERLPTSFLKKHNFFDRIYFFSQEFLLIKTLPLTITHWTLAVVTPSYLDWRCIQYILSSLQFAIESWNEKWNINYFLAIFHQKEKWNENNEKYM